MQSGDLRKAGPLQAAAGFLDPVISSRYLTAVVLGQNQNAPLPRSHLKHAVEIFLSYYSVDGKANQPGKRASAARPRKPSV